MDNASEDAAGITSLVVGLERAALDRWGKGDPEGFLEITAPDVTYFDPYLEQRVDGLSGLTAWYEPIRGKIRIDSDELVDPRVQVSGDTAILTMRYNSRGGEGEMRWNCTEVYQRRGAHWKIVHSHWSFTKPAIPGSTA